LFWKRKDRNDLEVSWASDGRSSYRVRPLPEEPILIEVEGQTYRVHDISAGGVSLQKVAGAAIGDRLEAVFTLPYLDEAVETAIRVVDVTPELTRGAFFNLAADQRDAIHRYVLENQKRRAKEQKPVVAERG